jgi:hypothetical protein
MATLKKILGSTIQVLDDDPVVGGIAGASWSSGGSLNTGRGFLSTGIGTQTAAAVTGGFSGPPNTYYANTEEYDGSSWTESGDLPSARYQGMAGGTQTAGIYAGGYSGSWPAHAETFYYNGTSWSDQSADLNTARDSLKGTGLQTAAIAAGGISGPGSPADDEAETWNGSSWTEVSELNTGRYSHDIGGISTDAIAAAGTAPPGYAAAVEIWNGSSWTEVTEVNTSRDEYGITNNTAGAASTGALIFGGRSQPTGSPAALTQTEFWNGSSWTEVADLAAGRSRLKGGGSTTAAFAVGAYPNTNNTATEEFSAAPITSTVRQEGQLYFKDGALKGFEKAGGIPAATYSAGGNLNTARGYMGGAGLQTAGLIFGGNPPSVTAATESYNGSSWTEVNDLNQSRTNNAGFGSYTAAICSGGSNPSDARSNVESWDGSSWTETAELNTERSDSAGSGSQTSGMIATGTTPSPNPASRPGGTTIVTETWNGSSWTEVADTNTQRLQAGMSVNGPTSNSIIAGGENGPGSQTADAETWNGTSWTEVNNLNTARATLYNFAGTGSQAVAAGGYAGTTRTAISEIWNGTSWTEGNDLSTGRNAGYGLGFGTASIHCGGNTPPYTDATEELSADITNTTVTTS